LHFEIARIAKNINLKVVMQLAAGSIRTVRCKQFKSSQAIQAIQSNNADNCENYF